MSEREIKNTTLSDLVLFACYKLRKNTGNKSWGVRQEELSDYLTKTFNVKPLRVEETLSNLTKEGYLEINNEGMVRITYNGNELMVYTRLPEDLHEKLFGKKEVPIDSSERVKVKENKWSVPPDAEAYTTSWHHAEKENVVSYK